jgi:DNA excision repair protein ERCC-4
VARVELKILADVHEGWSGVPRRLVELGVDVSVARLRVADYHVGPDALVERKTVRDLHESLRQGRFWLQISRLRGNCATPRLVIEGPDLDEGAIDPNAIRGVCLTVLELGVPIVRSVDADDTALWLKRLAIRAQGARRRRSRRLHVTRSSSDIPSREAVLAAVPGISTRLANALITKYGSVEAVIEASELVLDPRHWPDTGRRPGQSPPLAISPEGRKRRWRKRPVARARLRNGHPGGTHVACSGQAQPRHLGVIA